MSQDKNMEEYVLEYSDTDNEDGAATESVDKTVTVAKGKKQRTATLGTHSGFSEVSPCFSEVSPCFAEVYQVSLMFL